MAPENKYTHTITGECRLSFPHLVEPDSYADTGLKYSATLLFPKSSASLAGVKSDVDRLTRERFCGAVPKSFTSPLHDGDTVSWGGFEKSVWIKAKTTKAPVLLAADRSQLDASVFYAGCYVRASVTFYFPKSAPNTMAVILNALQFLRNGEPLASGPGGNGLDAVAGEVPVAPSAPVVIAGLDAPVNDDPF